VNPMWREGLTVYLVRHGETELNVSDCLRGRADVALNATGRSQAEALGRAFSGVRARRVLSSPLQRARHTAAPIARAASVSVETDYGLNDRDYGAWTGERRDNVRAQFGSVDAAPGVETWTDLRQRIDAAFHRIVASVDQGPIVLVAHDAVNRALLQNLVSELATDADSIPQRTGCWNKLIWREGVWRLAALDLRPGEGERP